MKKISFPIKKKLLSKDFYLKEDVVLLAKKLLGKYLFTQDERGNITSGIIVETEGYAGATDKASHAYKRKYTKRTKIMYEEGGIAYIYLCYGMHHLLNVVTNKKDVPHAILIRAIEPKKGIEFMMKRRNKKIFDFSLTSGPGSLTQAFGITKKHNGLSFHSTRIWIEDSNISFSKDQILSSPRIGIDYAKEHAQLPWRFYLKGNPWISKTKQKTKTKKNKSDNLTKQKKK